MTSEVFHCKRGVNQLFSQPTHIFNPTNFTEELTYNAERDTFPIVIHCVTEEGPEGKLKTRSL